MWKMDEKHESRRVISLRTKRRAKLYLIKSLQRHLYYINIHTFNSYFKYNVTHIVLMPRSSPPFLCISVNQLYCQTMTLDLVWVCVRALFIYFFPLWSPKSDSIVCSSVQLDQLVIDSAMEKRDMEHKHAIIQQRVSHEHSCSFSSVGLSPTVRVKFICHVHLLCSNTFCNVRSKCSSVSVNVKEVEN